MARTMDSSFRIVLKGLWSGTREGTRDDAIWQKVIKECGFNYEVATIKQKRKKD
jgi:hypothetical protein